MGEQEGPKIDSLPKDCGYELIKPIPVQVGPGPKGDAPYIASASDLGLFLTGGGETSEEAVNDLAVIIVDQATIFASEKADSNELVGVAEF